MNTIVSVGELWMAPFSVTDHSDVVSGSPDSENVTEYIVTGSSPRTPWVVLPVEVPRVHWLAVTAVQSRLAATSPVWSMFSPKVRVLAATKLELPKGSTSTVSAPAVGAVKSPVAPDGPPTSPNCGASPPGVDLSGYGPLV